MTVSTTPVNTPWGTSSWGQWAANLAPGYRDAQTQMQDLAYKQAATRNLDAEATQRNLDVQNQQAQQKIFQDLAKKRAAVMNQAENQIQTLVDTATALIDGGQPAAGAKLLGDAALIESRHATAKREQDQREQQQFARNRDMANQESQMWAGIQNQTDLDSAAMQWSQQFPQQKNPFAGQIYDPAQVQARRDTSKAGLAYMEEQRRASSAAELTKVRERAIKFYDTREKYNDEMLEIRKKQAERAAKGGTVAEASTRLENQAEVLIANRYKNLPESELQTAGFEIANRAKAIVRANPGVDHAEALDQAFNERKGDFTTLNETYKLFGSIEIPFTGHETTHYRASGDGEEPPAGRTASGKIRNAQPNVDDKGWTLMEDANGNRAYVSPDGKSFDPATAPADDDSVESDEPAEDWAARQNR